MRKTFIVPALALVLCSAATAIAPISLRDTTDFDSVGKGTWFSSALSSTQQFATASADDIIRTNLDRLSKSVALKVGNKLYDTVYKDKERYTWDHRDGTRLNIYYEDKHSMSRLFENATGVNIHGFLGPFAGLTKGLETLLFENYVKPMLQDGLINFVQGSVQKLYNTGLLTNMLKSSLLMGADLDTVRAQAQSIGATGNGVSFDTDTVVDIEGLDAKAQSTLHHTGVRIQQYLKRTALDLFAEAMPTVFSQFVEEKVVAGTKVGLLSAATLVSPTFGVLSVGAEQAGFSFFDSTATAMGKRITVNVADVVADAIRPVPENVQKLIDGEWSIETTEVSANPESEFDADGFADASEELPTGGLYTKIDIVKPVGFFARFGAAAKSAVTRVQKAAKEKRDAVKTEARKTSQNVFAKFRRVSQTFMTKVGGFFNF